MELALPGEVTRAIGMLEAAGFAAYAVGGCVRDRVLGLTPHDYDVCTDASPREMQRVFAGERTIDTGLKHGTLTVLLDAMPLEITTFRQDGAYLDGRHPERVTFTRRVEDDLARRDFTINAMAYSPARGLIDPFHGQEDCRAGVIRCVGDPAARFEEDSLRVLRALRFSARLGFRMEAETASAVHAGKAGLRRISRERIAAELNGLLLGREAGRVLAEFSDVLAEALHAGGAAAGTFVPAEAPAWPVALRRLGGVDMVLSLKWAALLADVLPSGGMRSVLEGLKQPRRLTDEACALAESLSAWRDVPLAALGMQERLMRLGPDSLRLLIALERADRTARRPEAAEAWAAEAADRLGQADALIRGDACWSLRQLAVRGGDLSALGLRGPQIGEMLSRLLLMVVRGEAQNDREALLAAARRDL